MPRRLDRGRSTNGSFAVHEPVSFSKHVMQGEPSQRNHIESE